MTEYNHGTQGTQWIMDEIAKAERPAPRIVDRDAPLGIGIVHNELAPAFRPVKTAFLAGRYILGRVSPEYSGKALRIVDEAGEEYYTLVGKDGTFEATPNCATYVKASETKAQRTPRFSGLQQGEVIARWYDRPSIVGPLFIAAGLVGLVGALMWGTW